MKITERIKAKSPKLFQRITNTCIVLGVIGGALLTAPISLPAGVVALAGYMVTAGVIGGTVSKLTVDTGVDNENEENG
jgi:ABC-type xylose transport system permease subunit